MPSSLSDHDIARLRALHLLQIDGCPTVERRWSENRLKPEYVWNEKALLGDLKFDGEPEIIRDFHAPTLDVFGVPSFLLDAWLGCDGHRDDGQSFRRAKFMRWIRVEHLHSFPPFFDRLCLRKSSSEIFLFDQKQHPKGLMTLLLGSPSPDGNSLLTTRKFYPLPSRFPLGYEFEFIEKAGLKELGALDEAAGEPVRPNSHSDDFTSVVWNGRNFDFTKGLQARAVAVLWEQYERGGHSMSQETIGDRIRSDATRFELRTVFRKRNHNAGNTEYHPAWGTMIQEGSRGSYRLVYSPDKII